MRRTGSPTICFEAFTRNITLNKSDIQIGPAVYSAATRQTAPLARCLVRLLVGLGALTAWTSPALAQDATPEQTDTLAAVRTRVAFGASQDRLVDQWIDAALERLRAAAGDDDGDSALAARQFRSAMAAELRHAQATPQFLQRFADRFSIKAIAQFKADQDVAVAQAVAAALRQIARVTTRDALTAGLKHADANVRYTCAATYAALLDDLSADVNTARRTITILKNAGKIETSGVVLETIYDALSFQRARFVGDVAGALAEIFTARVQRRAAGQDVRVDRAELTAMYYLYKVRSNIPQQAVAPLIRPLAGLLALDVRRYAAGLPDERRDLQERIVICEELIGTHVNGGGDVRGKMTAGGDVVLEEMGLELLKWVGGQGQQGALNDNPWNVPVGGLP